MTVDAFQLAKLDPLLGELYVVTPNVHLSEVQRRALAKQWEEAWAGSEHERPKLLVLPSGWTLDVIRQRVAMTAADLGLIEDPPGLVFEEISRQEFDAMKRPHPVVMMPACDAWKADLSAREECRHPEECRLAGYCLIPF